MERLTKRKKLKLSNGEEIVMCKHTDAECNDSCMSIQPCKWYKKVQEKLKEYEDAEEEGLLLKLPCKVGDTIYEINEGRIMEYSLCRNWRILRLLEEGFFGIKVFTTREEAEQVLAKESEHARSNGIV